MLLPEGLKLALSKYLFFHLTPPLHHPLYIEDKSIKLSGDAKEKDLCSLQFFPTELLSALQSASSLFRAKHFILL